MFQIIETRILSVITWYYLSFFVISIAMFGLTAGAVWVYLKRDRFTADTLARDLAFFAAAFAVSAVLSLMVQMALPVRIIDLQDLVQAAQRSLVWAVLLLAISVPFFYAGVLVSLALTRSPYPIGRVYGVDLAGAATGCLGVLLLLNVVDGPAAVLWVTAIAGLAAVLFHGSGSVGRDAAAASSRSFLGRPTVVFALLAALAAANSLTNFNVGPIYIKGKSIFSRAAPIFEEWNSFSRVAVFNMVMQQPVMLGPSRQFRGDDWSIEQRALNIDGDAATFSYRIAGDIRQAGFLRHDVSNLAYYLPELRRAAVVGVGAGRDMLSARVFGIPDITGVEINPIIMRVLTDQPGFAEFAGIGGFDGMRFVVDEARSWFARSKDRFDIIQMSLIDTWAATGAGAYTLSENGLYTVEAWRIFLDHLTANGVFTVSRWYGEGAVNETGRMVSLAVAAALEVGATEPRRHIFLVAVGNIATMVLSRSPLSAAHVDRLQSIADQLGFRVLISPHRTPTSPILARLLSSASRAQLETMASDYSLDLTPPTDERPFFFNQLPLRNLWKFMAQALPHIREGVASGNLRATYTLALLILLSAVLVVCTIVVPLRPAVRDVGNKLAQSGTAYFLLIGAGFMFAEIALLQRMSVFLGHPIYALSIVLFSIILATGIGSFVSDKMPLSNRTQFVLWACLTGFYLYSLTTWLPPLILAFESQNLLVRAICSVVAIGPAGFLMGFGFPTGMRLISAVDRKPTPWFWGINGAAGVLASSLAVLCSVAFGISATLIVAAVCYLLLIPAAVTIGFRNEPSFSELGVTGTAK